MYLTGRQAEILELAKNEGRVLVEELAQRFSVTPQTIRKDLNDLCDAKILNRIHGGAIFPSGKENVKYDARRQIAAPEKQAIGRAAAALIPDNASLFINIGTTTEAVGEALLDHQGIDGHHQQYQRRQPGCASSPRSRWSSPAASFAAPTAASSAKRRSTSSASSRSTTPSSAPRPSTMTAPCSTSIFAR